MRRLVLATPLALLATPALAEPANTDHCDYRPIAGTARYDSGVLTRQTHAAAYGAARFVEEKLQPYMVSQKRATDPYFYGAFRFESLGPTSHIPSFSTTPGCPGSFSPTGGGIVSDRYGESFLTQNAGNLGFAVGNDWIQGYYAGSVTYSKYMSGKYWDGYAPHLVGLETLGLGIAAPIYSALKRDDKDGNVDSNAFDFIAGVQLGAPDNVYLRLGYVGSQGLYGGLSVPKVKFEVSAAVTEKLKQLAYLKGGFDDVKWPGGQTSLFARASLLSNGVRVDPVTIKILDEQPQRIQWLTEHFRHRIGPRTGVDPWDGVMAGVEVAWQTRPTSELQMVRVDVGYRGVGKTESKFDVVFDAAAGMVKTPEQLWVGVDGKRRPFGVFTAQVDAPEHGFVPFGLKLAVNDPDVLRVFPNIDETAFTLSLFFSMPAKIGGPHGVVP